MPGALDNQDRRTRAMIDSLDAGVKLLAAVKPTSLPRPYRDRYYLGREREAELLIRLGRGIGRAVVSAFGAVAAALERLGVRRIAMGRRIRLRRPRRATPISKRTGSRWFARRTWQG